LKATELASDVAVKSGIYKPMWRVRQLGGSKSQKVVWGWGVGADGSGEQVEQGKAV